MGKTIYIAFLVIFAAFRAQAQSVETARVANPDSTANASTTTKPSAPERPAIDSASELTFAVKVVPGSSKKFNVEVVSPKSGYAEVSLLNSRGDQILILHKGKIASGPVTFKVDSGKMPPGLYYIVSKYEGGLQVADKVTVMK